METVVIKCENCGTANKVIVAKFHLKPKCHSCKTLLTWSDKPIDVNSGNYKKEVLDNPGITLIEFWSPTCGYCHAMTPTLEKFAHEKAGIIKLVKINTASDPYLASVFNISGVPTFALYNEGQKINQVAGAMTKEQLESWIRQNIVR